MYGSVERAVSAAIDDQRDAMRDLLASLVAIPTENPPANAYDACVEHLQIAIGECGLEQERIQIPSIDVPRSVVKAWLGGPGPTLYFHGHYDVVPAQSRDQFAPRVEGDTLFGRGSSDMKSGLVAMIHAMAALKAAGAPLAGRIGLVCVPDEETGGRTGSGALAAAGQLGNDAVGMLMPEPTSGVIWYANRGAFTAEVTVDGREAHVGLAHHGANAVARALPMLNALVALASDVERRGSVLLVGGRVDAGVNFNVVPGACRFTIDRRTNPDEDFEKAKREVLGVLRDACPPGVTIDVRVLQEGESASTPPDHAVGRALADSVTAVVGEPPAFESCPGLLETRFYARRRIPAYAYGPGILAVSHGPQEFVKIGRMVECAKIYALTAMRVLGVGQSECGLSRP
jgi:succinyl-diaminopimelate desuccinylase